MLKEFGNVYLYTGAVVGVVPVKKKGGNSSRSEILLDTGGELHRVKCNLTAGEVAKRLHEADKEDDAKDQDKADE